MTGKDRYRGTAFALVTCAMVLCVLAAWTMQTAAAQTPGAAPATPQVSETAAAPAPPAPEPGPEFAAPTTLDRSGRILAPVEINGRGPFRFILDTGANRSAMSAATAEALGLALDPNAMVSVHGITGSAVLPAVHVASFRAGELLFENQRLPVLPAAVFGRGVDGILGIDTLQQARIEVDFEHDRVTIRRSGGRPAGAGYIVVRAQSRHGGLLLVRGRVGSVRVQAILDTGAERSLGNEALRTALDARLRRPQEGVTTTVIGATQQIAEGTSIVAPAITLGPAQLNDLIVTFGDLHVFNVWSLLEEPALLIGMDLLGTLQRFVVDYRRGEFHFKTWETSPYKDRCSEIGCRVWMGGG